MDPPIVFYHYSYSPFARRVQWYMLLRGMSYTECIQPPVMPRPDVARLGIRHRRVPLLALGRDVYADSRLILAKLETLDVRGGGGGGGGGGSSRLPLPPLGAGLDAAPELRGLERLCDVLTVDSLFLTSSRLIPTNASLMLDPAFRQDRRDFFGRSVDPPADATAHVPHRAEALVEVRHAAALLEHTLLADGRAWLLATPTPSLADIEAVWVFHWLATLPGALALDPADPADPAAAAADTAGAAITAAQFPRLFAWIDRFQGAVRAARKARPAAATVRVKGAEAAAALLAAPFYEPLGDGAAGAGAAADGVDPHDPVVQATGLCAGQRVVVWPTDTGASGRDVGRLLRLTADETVLELAAQDGTPVHLHVPRHGFVVRPYRDGDGSEAKL